MANLSIVEVVMAYKGSFPPAGFIDMVIKLAMCWFVLMVGVVGTETDGTTSQLPFIINLEIFPNFTSGEISYNSSTDYTSDYFKQCGVRGGYYFNRIVGGNSAEKAEFPWQVSIQLKRGMQRKHICGGAVVDESWVLTAAHCVHEINSMALVIVAGDHNLYTREGSEQPRHVDRIFTNNFDLNTFANDIALLKVAKPFVMYKGNVAPICLPDKKEYFEGSAVVTGWGRLAENGTSPQVLQHLTLPLMEKYICKDKYRRIGYSRYTHNCQICAASSRGGKDACQGDSGGPLVCSRDNGKYYICGIVSWGLGCARAEYPGIYTEVSCFVDWIKDTMEENR